MYTLYNVYIRAECRNSSDYFREMFRIGSASFIHNTTAEVLIWTIERRRQTFPPHSVCSLKITPQVAIFSFQSLLFAANCCLWGQ